MAASGCRVEVAGLDNLITGAGQIIVSNHQSGFDIYSLTAFLPVQIRWIAKKELFHLPFMGWGMRAARYIPIDRENPRKAVKSLSRAAECVSRGFSPVIFPEGTRTRDGKLGEFKKGTLFIARKGRHTITPVTIAGTFSIMRKNSLRLHPRSVRITVSPPIPYEEMKEKGEKKVLEEIREEIQRNLVAFDGRD